MGHSQKRYQLLNSTRRVVFDASGIKFLIQTKGVGRSFQLDAAVLQLSLGVALLKLAVIAVDFLMLNVFPKRAIYAKEKYIRSEDFSNLEERKQEELERGERRRARRERKRRELLMKEGGAAG